MSSLIKCEDCGKFAQRNKEHDCNKSICILCDGKGWLHGCQNWSEAYIKKHGNPYYSKKCECQHTDIGSK